MAFAQFPHSASIHSSTIMKSSSASTLGYRREKWFSFKLSAFYWFSCLPPMKSLRFRALSRDILFLLCFVSLHFLNERFASVPFPPSMELAWGERHSNTKWFKTFNKLFVKLIVFYMSLLTHPLSASIHNWMRDIITSKNATLLPSLSPPPPPKRQLGLKRERASRSDFPHSVALLLSPSSWHNKVLAKKYLNLLKHFFRPLV